MHHTIFPSVQSMTAESSKKVVQKKERRFSKKPAR